MVCDEDSLCMKPCSPGHSPAFSLMRPMAMTGRGFSWQVLGYSDGSGPPLATQYDRR